MCRRKCEGGKEGENEVEIEGERKIEAYHWPIPVYLESSAALSLDLLLEVVVVDGYGDTV